MVKIELPLEGIKRKYESEYSTKELSLMYRVGQHIIQRRLKALGVKLKGTAPYIAESLVEKAERIYFNNPHISLTKLAKNLGVSREGLRYRLAKRGIKIRTSAQMTSLENKNRSKKVDLNKRLDSNFAYILGVLYGDGYVDYEGIHLSCHDLDFITSFKKAVEIFFNVQCQIKEHLHKETKTPQGKRYYNVKGSRMSFYSTNLSKWLIKEFGSFKSTEFRLNTQKLLSYGNDFCYSFIRGLFDSDATWKLQLGVGNLKGLMDIRNLLIKLGFSPTKITKGTGSVYYIRLNSYKDRSNYFQKIGFSIERKQKKLKDWLKNHTDIHTARLNNIKKAIEHNKIAKSIKSY